MVGHEQPATLAQRVARLEERVDSLQRRIDMAAGAIIVIGLLGQMVLAAWIGTVIR